MSDWITTKIPKELAEKVDEARKGTSKSRSQFVYDSVAETLQKSGQDSINIKDMLKEILESQKSLEEILTTILQEKGVMA